MPSSRSPPPALYPPPGVSFGDSAAPGTAAGVDSAGAGAGAEVLGAVLGKLGGLCIGVTVTLGFVVGREAGAGATGVGFACSASIAASVFVPKLDFGVTNA